MTPKTSTSNIQSQLNAWSSRGPIAKLKNALRSAIDLELKPGTPVVYSGSQYVITNRLGNGQVMLRGIDGRHVVANEDDLEPIAREFKGTEGAESK